MYLLPQMALKHLGRPPLPFSGHQQGAAKTRTRWQLNPLCHGAGPHRLSLPPSLQFSLPAGHPSAALPTAGPVLPWQLLWSLWFSPPSLVRDPVYHEVPPKAPHLPSPSGHSFLAFPKLCPPHTPPVGFSLLPQHLACPPATPGSSPGWSWPSVFIFPSSGPPASPPVAPLSRQSHVPSSQVQATPPQGSLLSVPPVSSAAL